MDLHLYFLFRSGKIRDFMADKEAFFAVERSLPL